MMIDSQILSDLSIKVDDKLITAMKKMDATHRKLLLVLDPENNFHSLLSVGDIQRYFIKHQDLEVPVRNALRNNVVVCSTRDPDERIKELMLEWRVEFMPVISETGELDRIVFWDDIFEKNDLPSSSQIDVPVVIMAGGKGTRLQPITNIIPKPLIPLGDRPIVQIIMDKFADIGVNRFHLSVNYKAGMIKDYLRENADPEYKIEYFEEDEPLGTAGSLQLLNGKISETFFVSNCDILIDQDFSEVYAYHKKQQNELSVVAAVKHIPISYGTLEVEDNQLKAIKEKPDFTYLINAGVYILEPHLIDEIPENEFFHITDLMEKIIARKGKVGVFPVSEGSWLDIGEWSEYQKTQKIFNKRFSHR